MTLEEFEAIDLPGNWFKNQPRESSVDGGAFEASPGADEVVHEEHFGFRWFHSATVVEVGVPVDDEGLLAGSLVEKVHEISYEPGSTVIALVSPDGETYGGSDATPGDRPTRRHCRRGGRSSRSTCPMATPRRSPCRLSSSEPTGARRWPWMLPFAQPEARD